MNETRLCTEEDLAPGHGFGCVDCGHQFSPGEEYVSVLLGMVGDTPSTEVKCRSCSDSDQRNP